MHAYLGTGGTTISGVTGTDMGTVVVGFGVLWAASGTGVAGASFFTSLFSDWRWKY